MIHNMCNVHVRKIESTGYTLLSSIQYDDMIGNRWHDWFQHTVRQAVASDCMWVMTELEIVQLVLWITMESIEASQL